MKCQLCETPVKQKTKKIKRYCDDCARRVNIKNAKDRKEAKQLVPDGYYVESAKDSGFY